VCGRDNRSYWWHVLNYLPTFRSGARFLIGYCFIAASKSESETKIGLQAIVTFFMQPVAKICDSHIIACDVGRSTWIVSR
jgi:hypothetical protein